MSKYIFIDCDGTLIPFTKEIPVSSINSLSKAKENGFKLILTTGRYLDEITEDIRQIGFNGFILNGGGYIQFENQEYMTGTIPFLLEQKICSFLEENNITYRLETKDSIYQKADFQKFFTDFTGDTDEYDVTIINTITNQRSDVLSIYAKVSDDLFFELQNQFPECIISGYMKDNHYSLAIIRLRNINKGYAIRYLKEKYNINTNDTISIGDDYNDISMFNETAISICMSNGNPIAKNNCTFVAETIEEGLKHFNVI